jgi:hypothetical protein
MTSDMLTVSLHPSKGFHPSVRARVTLPNGPRHARPPAMGMMLDPESRARSVTHRPACELHLAQALPSDVFVDPYELELRKGQYEATVYGERNLELPVHEMSGQGQVVLLRVAVPAEAKEVEIELPVHLRYGVPRKGGGIEMVNVTWPEAFWACPSNGLSHPMPALPMCSRHLIR